MKGNKAERREVADWIVLQNGGAEEYFNNSAIKQWGHIEDKKQEEKCESV